MSASAAEDRSTRRASRASAPPLRRRMARGWRTFLLRYCEVDLRTLGLLRVALGAFLVLHAVRLWLEARLYYSNEGVLSNDWSLFRPSSDYQFSLFHAFSSPAEVHVAFAVMVACAIGLAVGYRTKAFAFASFLWVTSLDSRLLLVENGGYIVVNLLAFWTLLLPTGRRFSVDAWLRARRGEPTPTGTHRSAASFLLLLNFAIIYLFNVVNKSGSVWRAGHSVHHALHLDRLGTPLGAWFREVVPAPMLVALDHSVLVVETLILCLIAWPRGRRFTRPIALVLIVGLHGSFGTMMRLGPFSWAMITYSLVLLAPVQWEILEDRWRGRWEGASLELPDDAAGWWLRRTVAALDPVGAVSFVMGAERVGIRRGTKELEGGRAVLQALSVHPLSAALVLLARLSTFGAVDVAARSFTRRPEAWARFFGWPRGGLPAPPAPPSPLRLRLRRWKGRAVDAFVGVYALVFVSQAINENKSIPKPLKHEQPELARALVLYPRLLQGWGMFAPNPVRQDGKLAIDALTVDGRHIDPLQGGRPPDLNISDDRSSMLNQIHQDYGNRIRQDSHRVHRTALARFLKRYHEHTGRPEDRLVWYAVYWVRDRNPEPGTLEPTDGKIICIATWRDDDHRPAPPPRCEVESADNEKNEGEAKDGDEGEAAEAR